jgi:zinc D-Ala-D-Ala carboxypeptidase
MTDQGEVWLSPHFSLHELTYSDTALACGIENSPDAAALEELEQLALVTLEGIRTVLGDFPIVISSGYRCPALNSEIGGATNSAHLYGCAADFVCPDFGTPLEVCLAIEPHMAELQIDQLIDESGWVHVGRASQGGEPRCECLTLTAGGGYSTGFG